MELSQCASDAWHNKKNNTNFPRYLNKLYYIFLNTISVLNKLLFYDSWLLAAVMWLVCVTIKSHAVALVFFLHHREKRANSIFFPYRTGYKNKCAVASNRKANNQFFSSFSFAGYDNNNIINIKMPFYVNLSLNHAKKTISMHNLATKI